MSTLNVDTIQDKGAAFEHARLVQVLSTSKADVFTSTSTSLADITGLSQAITPTHASNKLLIEAVVQYATASNVAMCCALFQDSTAGALACAGQYGSNREQSSISLQHYMTTGTTSSTTFKVRFGATSGTTTINGDNGARTYGGVCTTGITISEIRV